MRKHMADYFEIDFLKMESKKSGDAIPIRYSINGITRIHVTDGGYLETGEKVVEHINKYYGTPTTIDSIIVSHPDGDHANGLRKVIENFEISEIWMLRPWLYVDDLIDRFTKFTNKDNLIKRLKDIYPNILAIEELAINQNIPIYEPFQGAKIGEFTVLAPSKKRYLDLVLC
jgi:glyoxylase-like metal-dependent hydrolase (beta-lactamase superfamily II)